MRRGKLGGQFWSVYVGCPNANESEFGDDMYYKSIHDTLQQIDVIHRLADAYPDVFQFVLSACEIIPAFRRGRVASLLGVEGLHQIGNSAAILRQYYDAGVRYATLTHSCANVYADSASAPAVHGGLSKKGEKLVREFNRLGMMVDLSHVSADTMRQAIAVSKAPPFFSHSSAYAVCPHERNVPDDVLMQVKEGNGAVCVNFYSRYVRCEQPEDATLSDVADHIEYMGGLIGYDHICLGSDFDGIEITPEGLDDVSKYPDLVAELLRRGISDVNVEKVVGLNTIRVLRDTEKVAQTLKGKLPLEEKV